MKLINIRVIPNAKKNNVSEDQGKLKVHISAPAIDGKANKALIKVLAEHFKIKKNHIRIIKGAKSREKAVEILSS
ncbi:YggU family protein [bacterium]|nr:YggU family protein [bacterium]